MGKRFYRYEHRTSTLREFFIRTVLRRPIHVRRPHFEVNGIDLLVQRGDSVALVGPNGSGKSTTLRLIAGIYRPSSGVVRTTGRVASIIELGAGFHPELTGGENVLLSAAVLGLTRAEVTARFDDILAFAGTGDFADVPVKYYSSGMWARLAFAVSIAVDPDVLLLDEVLAVGDAEFRTRCLNRLRSFREREGTLVVVSHDLDTLASLCSRGVWMEDGRIRMDGEIGRVLDAYRTTTEAAES